jgi:hypothetical protein
MLLMMIEALIKDEARTDWNKKPPKVVVEWLTLLLRIREVLGPDTGYPN